MMIELPLKIPTSIYNQLQAAARRENQPIDEFLVGLISQNFSPTIPSPLMSVKNQREYLSHYRFVTEWTLPDSDR
ncbi:hypothetical protein HYR99_12540 [Candidatus Poribacteria bacterium]|nr:hypothetical protein [Candidatus Poribacteria bacterium]